MGVQAAEGAQVHPTGAVALASSDKPGIMRSTFVADSFAPKKPAPSRFFFAPSNKPHTPKFPLTVGGTFAPVRRGLFTLETTCEIA